MFHCNRLPVCQRSLLFHLSCLPASGLHLTMNTANLICQAAWPLNYYCCIIMIYNCTMMCMYMQNTILASLSVRHYQIELQQCIWNYIRTHYLPEIQNKATSCVWLQSSTPIGLAGQLMSALSVPKQRSSSSNVGVLDEAWEKL